MGTCCIAQHVIDKKLVLSLTWPSFPLVRFRHYVAGSNEGAQNVITLKKKRTTRKLKKEKNTTMRTTKKGEQEKDYDVEKERLFLWFYFVALSRASRLKWEGRSLL